MKKIRVTVELPWAAIPDVVEYYDLPDGWDEMSPEEQNELLTTYAQEELANTGVGCGASVVDDEDDEL